MYVCLLAIAALLTLLMNLQLMLLAIQHAWQQDALRRPTMSQMTNDLQSVLDDYLLVTQSASATAGAPPRFNNDQNAALRRPPAPDHEYMSITLDECAQQFEDLVNFH